MNYRSTPQIQNAIEERDLLKIRLSLLVQRGADAGAVIRMQQEIAGLTKAVDQLRLELNPDAPRMIRQRSRRGTRPGSDA